MLRSGAIQKTKMCNCDIPPAMVEISPAPLNTPHPITPSPICPNPPVTHHSSPTNPPFPITQMPQNSLTWLRQWLTPLRIPHPPYTASAPSSNHTIDRSETMAMSSQPEGERVVWFWRGWVVGLGGWRGCVLVMYGGRGVRDVKIRREI